MNKSLAIHHDNIIFDLFDNDIYFDFSSVDGGETVDSYISREIIYEIKEQDFDIIFIKDNLSSNYLELLGLRVAYHIRLSSELGDKRFLPIIILSDIDSYMLNSFDPTAQILFTKNIFIVKNTKNEIEKIKNKKFSNFTLEEYKTGFLNRITVEPPKDYLSHHSIANEWSIYRWSKFLDVDSNSVKTNNEKIQNMLYFKYLKEIYKQEDKHLDKNICKLNSKTKGNILLIDDEWNKGWSDILAKIFKNYDKVDFQTFKYDFKDKSNFNLNFQINHKGLKQQIQNADVIILDLRLIEQDHDEDTDIENYSGIKILEKIHEINVGIQVIMLTATSKSTILEKLYEKKILGYIKKEHPEDRSINTVENINKFIKLINKGLKRKYLKEIYIIKSKITNLLDIELTENIKDQDCKIFAKFNRSKDYYMKFALKIYREALYTFEVLDSNLKNRFIFAMLSIISSFEAINSILIKEFRNDDDKFWDGTIVQKNKLNDRLEELYQKLNGEGKLDIQAMIQNRNNYLHSNIKTVHIEPGDIVKLFEAELKMIQAIKNYQN